MSDLNVTSAPGPSANDANSGDAYGVLTSAELRGVFRSHLVRFCVVTGLAFVAGIFLAAMFYRRAHEAVDTIRCCGDPELGGVIETFGPFIKTGLNFAIAAGLLLFYYQVVAFASPRMTRAERGYACISLPFGVLFFQLGAALTFFFALPRIYESLENFRTYSFELRTGNFAFPLHVHVPLVMGTVFELLFILYMLARLGIVSPNQLAVSRHYVIVLALLAATVFTPWPLRLDVLLVVTGVIYALYEVGIIFSRIAVRRRNERIKQCDDERHCDLFGVMAMPENRDELRSRLVKVGVGFALAFLVGLYLTRPLLRFVYENVNIERTGLDPPPVTTADFFRTGLNIAVAFSILMIYYQIIAFASPILTRKERRYAYGSLPLVALCFLFGTVFAFFALLSRFSSRTDFFGELFGYGSVLSFHVHVSLAIGSAIALVFVMVLLARLGIVSPMCMSACRGYAAVIAIMAATFVTPMLFSLQMFAVAAGLYLIYEFGIILARIAWWQREQRGPRHADGIPVLEG